MPQEKEEEMGSAEEEKRKKDGKACFSWKRQFSLSTNFLLSTVTCWVQFKLLAQFCTKTYKQDSYDEGGKKLGVLKQLSIYFFSVHL